MPPLRIGIDVGGTFTHGVVLRPPGEVLLTARTPTTHTHQRGVAAGIATVLAELIAGLTATGHSAADVELVAHSTTQATNALLEGDVSGVHLHAIAPPGERFAVKSALGTTRLDVGNGHHIRVWPKLLTDWEDATAQEYPAEVNGSAEVEVAGGAAPRGGHSAPDAGTGSRATGDKQTGWSGVGKVPNGFTVSSKIPVAVVQALAGKHELREHNVAAHYRACGHSAVCAADITQVLGLKARGRTAIVNAAMLPTMLATADYTEAAVRELLPHAQLQVVRSDGGAMSIEQMRRQPILSLLSGPAAGASAALHRSGLADVVFIEVGGTSTDITLIKDGRVRHRYATVGGQQLMVPALDLRTVAVGGGSMLRADAEVFGSRSAHIAGLRYAFQEIAAGNKLVDAESLVDLQSGTKGSNRYVALQFMDGHKAAYTLTDYWLSTRTDDQLDEACSTLGIKPDDEQIRMLRLLRDDREMGWRLGLIERSFANTIRIVTDAVRALASSQGADLSKCALIAGGGGGPAIVEAVAGQLKLKPQLIPDYPVISAIGAALAVTCVSVSRSVAQPGAGDIAELTGEVEARLAAQGAERVSTDFEYDPQRQVLTVTGRGSRPYEQGAERLNDAAMATAAIAQLDVHFPGEESDITRPELLWSSDTIQLWQVDTVKQTKWFGKRKTTRAVALDRFGRTLWQGSLDTAVPAPATQLDAKLAEVLAARTQYTDGGPALPGLAVLADGRFIPLDQLGSAELALEVLRWERIPAGADACIVIRG